MGNSNPTFRALSSSEAVFTGDDGYADANNGMSLRCIQGILGCINPTACNFDPQADTDDNSCEFPFVGFHCNGDCIDDNGNGVCNFDEIQGCTDESAFNFDPLATEEDGSCMETIEGCTLIGACNYNEFANTDDGSCEYESCTPAFEACGDPVSYQGYNYATVQIG